MHEWTMATDDENRQREMCQVKTVQYYFSKTFNFYCGRFFLKSQNHFVIRCSFSHSSSHQPPNHSLPRKTQIISFWTHFVRDTVYNDNVQRQSTP